MYRYLLQGYNVNINKKICERNIFRSYVSDDKHFYIRPEFFMFLLNISLLENTMQ